ncbi:uncharacterized protein BDR25DRAFT_340145 [Lindgomyces ingoldianus]|uniref:Uncharacterized protein n=1 Tax=Lindgomyces ingoldianus TaxID=673940 RepID=A0ACB6R9E4_9PLEO|nr:uncharacterized protein BDR25DRAFT_340145 [Lindgomyces ingoldianus]KAF2475360.1 hypothetical protein BDR25DRAFT_340145 [Lindgomyces ingoldianus]
MRTERLVLLSSVSFFSSTCAFPTSSARLVVETLSETHWKDVKRQNSYQDMICERNGDGTDSIGGYRTEGYAIADFLEKLGGGNQDCTLERPPNSGAGVVAMIGGTGGTEVNMYFTERNQQQVRGYRAARTNTDVHKEHEESHSW